MADTPLKRPVQLFYIGDGSSKGEPRHYQSLGRAFVAPPIGGAITVPLYYARDLMKRGHNGVHSVWSMSPRDAELAKRGELRHEVRSPMEMSVEELEQLLAARRLEEKPEPVDPPQVPPAPVASESGGPTISPESEGALTPPVDPPAPKSRKSKKTEEAE